MKLSKVCFLLLVCCLPINSFVFPAQGLVASGVDSSVALVDQNQKISGEVLKSFFQKFSSMQPIKSTLNFGKKVYVKGTENPKLSAGAICAILIAAGIVYFIEKDNQACHESILELSEQPTIIGYLCTQYLLIEQKINDILSILNKTKVDENIIQKDQETVILHDLMSERDKIEAAILAIYKKENSFFTRLKSIFYKNN